MWLLGPRIKHHTKQTDQECNRQIPPAGETRSEFRSQKGNIKGPRTCQPSEDYIPPMQYSTPLQVALSRFPRIRSSNAHTVLRNTV